jgi:hypothetical protein
MAPRKKLDRLIPDLRGGLQLSLEMAARDTTTELKERGPYWSGDFEAAWEVHLGQVRVPSDKEEGPLLDKPAPRQVTPFVVPIDDTDSLRGYTISNRMEYADKAMDLEPGDDGVYRGDRKNQTAQDGKDWFERYMLGGAGSQVLGRAVKQAMGVAGFKR